MGNFCGSQTKTNSMPVQKIQCSNHHQIQNLCLSKKCKQDSLFCLDTQCSKKHVNCEYIKIKDVIKLILHLQNIQMEQIRPLNQRIKQTLKDYFSKEVGNKSEESVEKIYKHMRYTLSRTENVDSFRMLGQSDEKIDKLRGILQAQYEKKLISMTDTLKNIEKDISRRYFEETKALFKIIESPKEKIHKLKVNQETKDLKILSLDATNTIQKLTADDIKQFTKVVLPSVENINLKGNAVGDQGLQVLCQTKYNNLKEIDLNDNQIGVKGVSALVNNTWSKQVKYKLQAVITKDGGYALKAGESVTTMKTLIKSSKSIDNKAIDELQQKNKKQLFQSMHLMMETPLEGKPQQILKESQAMCKQLEEAVKKNPVSAERVLLTLKETFQSTEVTFSKTTNARSQLSIKILSTGMEEQNVMIKHRIVHKEWNFKDFKNNSAKVAQFQEWYKQKIAKEYNADLKDITIHKITEGSVNVLMSMSTENSLLKSSEFSSKEQITLVPFFAAFNLSIDDFDPGPKKDITFPNNEKCETQWRGGIPYLQPIHCNRVAIKVLNLYDNGNNDWISMDGVAGQYAVAFHGVNQPAKQIPDKKKTILQSIMSGRKAGEMLATGGLRQAHKDENALNKVGQKVESGVYLSPYFSYSLINYTQQCKKLKDASYRVIFQVRFKPDALKCTSTKEHWVINQSKDVRPYGVILFTPQQFQLLQKKGDGIYPRTMEWNSWKKQYEEFRKRHKLPL